jgi:hypothetical protein
MLGWLLFVCCSTLAGGTHLPLIWVHNNCITQFLCLVVCCSIGDDLREQLAEVKGKAKRPWTRTVYKTQEARYLVSTCTHDRQLKNSSHQRTCFT